MRGLFLGVLLALSPLAGVPAAFAVPAIITFAVRPGADVDSAKIENNGIVAGDYRTSAHPHRGYVRSAAGTIVSFSVPGSTETIVDGISKGVVAGHYFGIGLPAIPGFLRFPVGGSISFEAGQGYTEPTAINNGVVVGAVGLGGCVCTAFIRSSNGTITQFGVPGAGQTVPTEVDRYGNVVGWFGTSTAVHGFYRSVSGSLSTFDGPGSTFTIPDGISPTGSIVGTYYDAANVGHAFLRTADGAFTTIDVPGSTFTNAAAINAAGSITGVYEDGMQHNRGYARAPDGTITAFDVPGSNATIPNSINDAGVIAGTYHIGKKHGHYYGFLRTP